MNDCPCCSGKLLRHVRRSEIYWRCSDCRQETSDFIAAIKYQKEAEPSINSMDSWSRPIPLRPVTYQIS